ncbi:MAG: ChrR family anti-sigma-E factor [Asticcacaulis sp.]
MSAPQHHPDDMLLWDYHRGACSPGLSLTLSAHLSFCQHCCNELRLMDNIGGALLEEVQGVDMSDSALELALARIDRPVDAPAIRQVPAFLKGLALPTALRQAAFKNRYWAAPGVWLAPLDIEHAPKGSKTFLMHVAAGMVMPEHTHRGMEATLVLKGRFSDCFGAYGVGDFIVCDDRHSHSPMIADDEDCLCLAAQDAAIIPKTLLGKLLQPFARI